MSSAPPKSSDLSAISPKIMEIKDGEFRKLRDLVYDRFGINLTDQKRSLLVGRLQKHLQQCGITSFSDYYDYLINDKSGKALDDLINRVSTNYSYFYRENAHFDYFTSTAFPNLISQLTQQRSKDIRIWTAGCSTGEEPYMIIILMMEYLGMNYYKWDGGVLGTDISDRALQYAKEAVYPQDRVDRIPSAIRKKYFIDQADAKVSVKENVKRELTLRRFNLMNANYPFRKAFHIIFCRNVMIYFDKNTRDTLIRKFHQHLVPGGYLFIGHSETIGRDQKLFRYIMPACYQKIADE